MCKIQDAIWELVSSAERGDFTSPALEYKWKDLGDIYFSVVALENTEAG